MFRNDAGFVKTLHQDDTVELSMVDYFYTYRTIYIDILYYLDAQLLIIVLLLKWSQNVPKVMSHQAIKSVLNLLRAIKSVLNLLRWSSVLTMSIVLIPL